MIEVNLSAGRKPFKLPVLLGIFDLGQLNFKLIFLCLLLYYLGIPLVQEKLEEKGRSIIETTAKLNERLENIQKQGKGMRAIQAEIEDFQQQEKRLFEKLEVVRKIIKIKKNPMGILLYISKNIPQDLWLTSLEIQLNEIKIEGESRSYKSIGLFIENLKDAIFFGSSVRLEDSMTVTNDVSGTRTESFKISATIMRFD